MARRVSEVVRERGCIPATVGIVAGRVHVGLDDQQIRMLCDPKTKSLKESLLFISNEQVYYRVNHLV